MKKTMIALALAAGLTSFSGSAKADILKLSGAEFESLSGALPYSTPSQTDYWGIAIAFDGTSFNFGRYAVSVNNNWTINAPDSMDGFSLHANPGYTITSSPIVFGATIDSTLGFTHDIYGIDSSFSNAYYGLAYQAGGDFNYGWLELSYNGSDSTLVAGGMKTTLNESITAGQTDTAAVPEPSTYALFGIGAIGMLMVRRRKKTV